MEKRYQSQGQEDKIYSLWQKSKAFTPKRNKKSATRRTFTIIMPPPNANAPLHIGHAMFATLEDILIRYHRMKGETSLWLPGADHAGILTQVVFERKLAKVGKTRFDLGRKKFFKECFNFTQENKKIMFSQLEKIGASCDWSRTKFTLDKKISKQVLQTFIDLYQDGLAYRGERLINWCPRCMTALSDLEVEYKEVKTKLWYIKYPLKTHSSVTGQTMFLIVATTRPETILGDTALAVHPEDQRYEQFIGQKVIVPFVNREIPIISDRSVDQEFGTGVVKVTPACDPKDYQMGLKHKLAIISVIDYDSKMKAGMYPEVDGLNIYQARKKIVDTLNQQNLLIKQRNYNHSVAHCERCKTIVEPLMSKQWFINVTKKIKISRQTLVWSGSRQAKSLPGKNQKLSKLLGVKESSLRQLGVLAVKKKLIKILPKHFEDDYLTWMKNLHDWCVSRQIWWGHRMPIWYCGLKGLSDLQKMMHPNLVSNIKYQISPASLREAGRANIKKAGCGHTMVSLKKPKKCPKCGSKIIIQDPDTFDCWFSSGQWPYTALGYPNSHDYKYFYPTSVLGTGYEILNIWVAKMIMLGLYRTQKAPFETVYLHGLVRDAFGEKMSKSKGNAINPLEVIERYGADALRMALIIGAGPGNDISVTEEKIKGYRNFTNKVWNIGRFILLSLKSTKKKIPEYNNKIKGLTEKDKDIVNKLNKLIKDMTVKLDEYQFSSGSEQIYQFLWHEFADIYIEAVKDRAWNKDRAALATLLHVYKTCLKLLHPFMPFITETIWSRFPRGSSAKAPGQELPKKKKELLILSSWPKA